MIYSNESWCTQGTLKKGKVDDREKFLKKIINDKQINSNLFGINN